MEGKQIKKYCDGLDCAICNEKEPCIYKIANELEEKLQAKEQECKGLEEEKLDRQNALTEMINILYPNSDDDELFTVVFNSEYIDKLKEVVEQLKSKERECEKRQNEWAEAVEEKLIIQSQNDELEIKNINLTEQLDQLKAELQATKGLVTAISKENFGLIQSQNEIDKKIDKYEIALQEIKEIAEQCFKKDLCADCEYCEQCYIEDEEIPTYDICKLILQKISEVEDDNA